MTGISINTIAMAIRCVNMELTRVAQAIKKTDDDVSADTEEELMLLGNAAAELKSAYLQMASKADNLASYEELIDELVPEGEHS